MGKTIKSTINVGNVSVSPLYFNHVEKRLPDHLRERYRETGRLKYGEGEIVLCDFGARRETDGGKIFAMYFEEENERVFAVQEIDDGFTRPDYIGYTVAKNLVSGSWTWMRSIEELETVVSRATEISKLQKLSGEPIGGELMRRRVKDKKVFIPHLPHQWDGICG